MGLQGWGGFLSMLCASPCRPLWPTHPSSNLFQQSSSRQGMSACRGAAGGERSCSSGWGPARLLCLLSHRRSIHSQERLGQLLQEVGVGLGTRAHLSLGRRAEGRELQSQPWHCIPVHNGGRPQLPSRAAPAQPLPSFLLQASFMAVMKT